MLLLELLARFAADDGLKITHHLREGVWAHHRADGVQIVGRVVQVFLEGAVHRVLERRLAARNGHQLAAQDAHLGDVGVFFFDVHLAHVDLARNAHQCAGGCQRHAVLARAGFGDHLGLAHELGEQCFAQAMVDLVRAGVVQVLTLQVDLCAAKLIRQSACVEDGAGAAHIVGKELRQFVLKILALHDFIVGGADVVHGFFQVRRHELAAVGAEKAVGIGHGCCVE
ncbi:hypothetical protein SDC9_98740 [bioreactor metagenome]|uniref:NAD-specific glutamate dehydrogenase n=1 Tax=bioreactor metagenome TaxID=1076179 RepID=A0A645AG46_9ZZZZ